MATEAQYLNPIGLPTDEHASFGWKLWTACVVMVIASGTFTTGRVWTRISINAFGADDAVCIFAQLMAIINVTCWAISVRKGYGVDTEILTTPQIQAFLRWFFIGQPFYLAAVTGYKVSIVLLSQRIFIQKPFQIACWTLISCCLIAFITIFFLTVFQCYPINTMWGHAAETAKCIEINNMLKAWGGFNIASDIAILILPLPMIWQLNLKLRQKLLLMVVFMTGLVVLCFSILSASSLLEGIATRADKYSFKTSNLFQVLEENMGIIGCCLPVLRHPLQALWPRVFRTTRANDDSQSPYYYAGYKDHYEMSKLPSGKLGSKKGGDTWHSVSVSGPEASRMHTRRASDEMGIINEFMGDSASHDTADTTAEAAGDPQRNINKHTVVSVNRV